MASINCEPFFGVLLYKMFVTGEDHLVTFTCSMCISGSFYRKGSGVGAGSGRSHKDDRQGTKKKIHEPDKSSLEILMMVHTTV